MSADKSALSQNLSGDLRRVCDALAQAAAALTAVAGAIGQGSFSVQPQNSTRPHAGGVTVLEAVNEFLRAKARAGRSDRYLRALRVSLSSFVRGRATVELGNVTVGDLETWISAHGWAPRTQKGYLSDVRVFFNWSIRRELVRSNPAAAVELPEDAPGAVTIHTPAQVRAVLEFARGYDLNLCRVLAIRYFAGLRSIEVERSQDCHIGEARIEVTAANAKKTRKRQRRLVTIQPCLARWLALGGSIEFGNPGHRSMWFNAALRKATGIKWSHNAARHTFVSYHLAQFRNAALTALEAGHTEQMLFANYREVVTPEAAEEFWGIVPKKVAQAGR